MSWMCSSGVILLHIQSVFSMGRLLSSIRNCVMLIALVFGVRVPVSAEESLNTLGPCKCEIGDKIVDLTPLAFHNNTPRFKDLMSHYPFEFSWNPCFDFNEVGCRGVAGCQVILYPRQYYSLGSQSSAKCLMSENQELQLRYQADVHRGIRRILYVTLVCTDEDKEEKMVVNGERPSEKAVYDMTLHSRYACPQPKESGSGVKLSVGSIISITAVSIVFVYAVSGVLFQKFVRKATGVQVIPHVTFWSKLPGLIKDGFLFVKKRGKVNEMYQAVS